MRPSLWQYLLYCMFIPTLRSWISQQPSRSVQFFSHHQTLSPESIMSSPSTKRPLIVVIAGPTGVGKSDVAARLCKSRKGMVVSADSVQAFRDVQIGANKPTAQERKETPHLLVDVVDATETYNAAEWQRDALYCIQSLLQENPEASTQRQQHLASEIASARVEQGYEADQPLLPLVVGGTMMYLQWLIHGRPDAMRPSDEVVKRATQVVEGYRNDDQWDEAVKFVSSFGESFALRTRQFSGQDWYRLRRTLEVAYMVQECSDPGLLEKLYSGEREGGLESLEYDVRCFFLCPDDRMNHTEVVDRRCEEMLVRGLLKETADLEVSNRLPEMAARAIGYRQTLDYLKREDFAESDDAALDAFLNDFTTATRRYAKKQMQWFRKDESFVFVPVPIAEQKRDRVCKTADFVEQLCSLTRDEYEQELKVTKDDGTMSISEQTRKRNEEQGKKMKFYQFKRHLIKPGSNAFREVLQQADECVRRLQNKPTKKQRHV